ncbi:PREDICTED: VQ motif-containing protein 22-like [Camelina sativa]|uniref:VQ motif-containing protein 22-like n=1 Tax=Camelina sativa TaxID=90675 RepID=A0ABM0U7F2_CAMSA|nr:PREDICTED: VQ motif-containing protein 22-like [Camelina sativa]
MESGNSSSMQSSSGGGGGGEEEYDSRAADQSISAFFDHHVSSLPPPQQNYLNLLHFDHNNNNSLISPNYFNNNNTFLPVNQQTNPISQPDLRTFSATSSLPPHNNIGVTKKTKKRSRASRRAPTTVLTTDTSNFRAMVQEFTGIPAPPLFNNNSVVNTTRLNTFLGLSSSSPNSYNNNNLLLRPFAQKLMPTSPLLSGSQIQQFQNPNNGFENMNLQALLQAHISNPRSNDHDQFGLGINGMMQSPSANPHTAAAAANGNITTGDNASYGGSDHDHNNDGTWLCSSSDQRT